MKQIARRFLRRPMGIAAPAAVPLPPAPPGRGLLLLRAVRDTDALALAGLALRLQEAPDAPGVVLVCPSSPGGLPQHPALLALTGPEPRAEVLLDHYRPAALALAGPELPVELLQAAALRNLPVALANATDAPLSRRRWWPRWELPTLHHLGLILAEDEGTAARFLRAGAGQDQVERVSALAISHGALPCNEAERAELAGRLGTRPIWLAAGLPLDEVEMVIAAHRQALLGAHRLVLVVVPADPSEGPRIAALFSEALTTALRSEEDEIDDETQVYVADTENEMGLWYRLAPVAYIGGTFTQGHSQCNPLDAAALGAAILHGPQPGALAPVWRSLAQARAAERLRQPADLGNAVLALLAPERAAALAHEAWALATDGAEATDRLAAWLMDRLQAARPDGGRR